MGRGDQESSDARRLALLFRRRRPHAIPAPMKRRPVDLSDLHMRFREGYTDDEITVVLSDVSERFKAQVLCIWEYLSPFGFGGDSFFVVLDGDKVKLTPPQLDAILFGSHEEAEPSLDRDAIRSGELLDVIKAEDVLESDDHPHNALLSDEAWGRLPRYLP